MAGSMVGKPLLPFVISHRLPYPDPYIDQPDTCCQSANEVHLQQRVEAGKIHKQAVVGPETRPREDRQQHSQLDIEDDANHQAKAIDPDGNGTVWVR